MIQHYENVQWRVVSYFETGIEFMGWERGIRLEDWNKMWNAIPNKKFPIYQCVCVLKSLVSNRLLCWNLFFWGGGGDQGCIECVQGILPGRRSKNKRWGGSGFAFIDWDGKRIVAGCHSWKLRTSRQSSVWLSRKLWRQQEIYAKKLLGSETYIRIKEDELSSRLCRLRV